MDCKHLFAVMRSAFISFMLDDYTTPIHDVQRLTFYLTLFYLHTRPLEHPDDPSWTQLPWTYFSASEHKLLKTMQRFPDLYHPTMFRWLPACLLPSSGTIEAAARVGKWSYLCAALGLGGAIVRGIAAAATLFVRGSIGVLRATHGLQAHKVLLPTWTALLLVPACAHGRFSLDFWLAAALRRLRGRPATQHGTHEAASASVRASRKALLCTAVAPLFLGGVHKLGNAGLAWADGRTLALYLDGSRFNGAPLLEPRPESRLGLLLERKTATIWTLFLQFQKKER
eukprot:385288-Pleurochrysis_carterae.AAC.4